MVFGKTLIKISICLVFSLLGRGAVASEKVCANEYPVEGPIYSGNYAPALDVTTMGMPTDFGWIAYNVHYGEDKVPALAADIRAIGQKIPLDFVLLQEVNGAPDGSSNTAQGLAKELGLNYVYAPAHRRSNRDHGTAILSRWPLTNPHKITLPNSAWVTCRRRAPIVADAQVGGLSVRLYSVHLATWFPDSFFTDAKRLKQIAPVIADMGRLPAHVPAVMGGDLNTVNPIGVAKIKKGFAKVGAGRMHKTKGATFKDFPFHLDHTYAKGFSMIGSGTDRSARASDHYPIWGMMRLTAPGTPLEFDPDEESGVESP